MHAKYVYRMLLKERLKIIFKQIIRISSGEEFDEVNLPVVGMITHFNPDSKMYTIRSDEDNHTFDLENSLILWPACTIVEIIGLVQDTTWNNRRGHVLGFDPECNRYSVQMSRDDIIRVLPGNVRA